MIHLANSKEPFCLTLLTVDTHNPSGYFYDLCQYEHDDMYANVISCASRQVYDFVRWVQDQDFYENTTIILCGDHCSMATGFFDDFDPAYQRTPVNIIINPAIAATSTTNRAFTVFDYFPTTLAALWVDMERSISARYYRSNPCIMLDS